MEENEDGLTAEQFQLSGLLLQGVLASGAAGQKAVDRAWEAASLLIKKADQEAKNLRANARAKVEAAEAQLRAEAEARRQGRPQPQTQPPASGLNPGVVAGGDAT